MSPIKFRQAMQVSSFDNTALDLECPTSDLHEKSRFADLARTGEQLNPAGSWFIQPFV
jgi:hypothetical protein